MKNFRKHLSILLAAAMLFGSAQFTFAGGEDPLPEETLIEVASEIAAEESSNSAGGIQLGNLTVSGFNGTLTGSGSEYQIKDGDTVEATFTSGAAAKLVISDYTGELTLHTDGTFNGTIDVASDADLVLNGVGIDASGMSDAAITIEPGVTSTVTLESGSENTLQGGSGFAGLSSAWADKDNYASLTILGSGTLHAFGGSNSAGIGGSKSNKGLYGDITIGDQTNDPVIHAVGAGGGAGIGSSDNPNNGKSNGSFKHVSSDQSWGVITINNGEINATGGNTGNGGAGIGGGNHVDSGLIIINGGVVTAEGSAGIGCSIGSSKSKDEADKGPGHYFATVEINGGEVYAYGRDIGAGIGGAMYCDAVVHITGGTIEAYSGEGRKKATHGGAAIGGGYQGHADIDISGGTVIAKARGNTGAPGIGSGTAANSHSAHDAKKDGRSAASLIQGGTTIKISGDAKVTAYGGALGGAGIGSGVGSDYESIDISGDCIVKAYGGSSARDKMEGGAGIGSAYAGEDFANFNESGEGTEKYYVLSDTSISITGGDVTAIGGWGAAGIGSGAENKMANEITIDAIKAKIEAYADSTKFAIDTRVLDGEETSSRTEGRHFTGDILQSTFVHAGKIGDYDQNPEGLNSIIVTNDATGESKELKKMPEGYRSFALDVPAPGNYTVYTDDSDIGRGKGRYFSECSTDVYKEENILAVGVQYRVETGKLKDNFYLFPVKSVVVQKVVDAPKSLKKNINMTVNFGLWVDAEKAYLKDESGNVWLESIEIVDGVPQGNAYFVNIPDKTFGIWELNEDLSNPIGQKFGAVTLKNITTSHVDIKTGEETTENDATINDEIWSDMVRVHNEYVGERVYVVKTTAEVKGTARMEDIDHSLLFTLQETRPNQQGGTDEPNQPAGTSSKASLRMASGSSGFEPKSLTFTDGVCGEYLIFTDIPEGKVFTAVEVDAEGNPVKAGTRYPGGYRLESDPVCKEVEPFAVEGIPEGAAVTYLEVHNVYTASSGSSGGTDPTPTPGPVTPPVDPDPVDPPADPDPTDIPDDPTPQAGPTGGVDDGSDEYSGKDPDSGLEDMEDEDTPKTEYSPLTGDERHTAVWAGVSLASLAAILWLASRRRKEE